MFKLFLVCGIILATTGPSSGLDCYQCFNIKGATPTRPTTGFNYGSGCEANSLDKNFNSKCDFSRKAGNLMSVGGAETSQTNEVCLKLQSTIGNITVVIRDCGWADEKKKCASENIAPYWTELKGFENIFFTTPVLPALPPTGTMVDVCSCDKNKCNEATNLKPALAASFAIVIGVISKFI